MRFGIDQGMPVASFKVCGFGISDETKLDPSGYLFNPDAYDLSGAIDRVRPHCHVTTEYGCPALDEMIHYDGHTVCVVIPQTVQCSVEVLDQLEPQCVQYLKSFPNYTTVMDSRNGRKISSSGFFLFKRDYDAMMGHCNAQKLVEEFELVEQAERLGFQGIDDAIQYSVPNVPQAIRELCRYLHLFSDPQTIIDLRPMCFCYRRDYVDGLDPKVQRAAI